MKSIIQRIITDILMVISQSFVYCLLFAVVAMFFYLYAREKGISEAIQNWIAGFKRDKRFRRLFFLVFYVIFVLFVTMFNRFQWTNPLQNIWGVWGIYNTQGELTTEFIENIALFIPLGILLPMCFEVKISGKVWLVVIAGLLFSTLIELAQLIFHIGQVQLSDLFCNTVGTEVGYLLYRGISICRRKKR